MNLYDTLDTTYALLSRRRAPQGWRTDARHLDTIVETIRADQPDATRSDAVVGQLLVAGRVDRDAWTVLLFALAPKLRCRLGRAATDQYRSDALTDLALAVAEAGADTLTQTRLAHRLVNRAHTRAHKTALRAHGGGLVRPVTVEPTDPARLADHQTDGADLADTVATRVDLIRFHHAARQAVATGELHPNMWDAYRAHRLSRAVGNRQAPCSGTQRQLACRAATQLRALIDRHLHAA